MSNLSKDRVLAKSKESTDTQVVVGVDRSLELDRGQVEKPFLFLERFQRQQKG